MEQGEPSTYADEEKSVDEQIRDIRTVIRADAANRTRARAELRADIKAAVLEALREAGLVKTTPPTS